MRQAVLWIATSLLSAQIIDTMWDSRVTVSDTVNKRLNVVDGFTVRVIQPKRRNRKGLKVRYGTSWYYLHVIQANEVYIDSVRLNNHGKRVYLLIASPDKVIPWRLPSELTMRAQYLKGMVDNVDSLIKAYRKNIRRNERAIDSLRCLLKGKPYRPDVRRRKRLARLLKRKKDSTATDTVIPPPVELPLSEENKMLVREQMHKRQKEIQFWKREIKIYREFKANKRGRSAPKFFTRYYFRRGFKYDIYAQIYGLPTFYRDQHWLNPPIGKPKSPKHRVEHGAFGIKTWKVRMDSKKKEK